MKKKLTVELANALLEALRTRFEENMSRHEGIQWTLVHERLIKAPARLWTLHEMERTGGDPDVVGHDIKTDEFLFFDCSEETPKGRVSVCYDREGLESRKDHPPKTTATDMAAAMGVDLLTEEQYFALQKLGAFDTKTSSWLRTPPEIRKLGGALYGERRYERIFIGHNGAQSYYRVRGFRAVLRI